MSTPADPSPWTPAENDPPAASGGPAPYGSPAPYGGPAPYGSPGSPAYGQYGQQPVGQPDEQPAYQQPYQQGPGGGEPWAQRGFEPAGALTNVVIALSVLVTVFLWLAALLSPSADRAVESALAADGDVTAALASYSAVAVLTLPAWLASWIVTSIWLTKGYRNAEILTPGGQRRSAIWIWLGWIVPIVSFWFPKQILDDVARATSSRVSTGPYWAAFVVMALLNSVQFQLSRRAAEADLVDPTIHFAIAIAATVALALWIVLVRRIGAAQDRLAQFGR
jgi:Domain of unknown function (DUF4328)